MTLIAPGTCRHCGCTELNPCMLQCGETCCWSNRERTVCSNPACIKGETARAARVKMESRPRKKTPAEIHELIRNRGRRARKGRAA